MQDDVKSAYIVATTLDIVASDITRVTCYNVGGRRRAAEDAMASVSLDASTVPPATEHDLLAPALTSLTSVTVDGDTIQVNVTAGTVSSSAVDSSTAAPLSSVEDPHVTTSQPVTTEARTGFEGEPESSSSNEEEAIGGSLGGAVFVAMMIMVIVHHRRVKAQRNTNSIRTNADVGSGQDRSSWRSDGVDPRRSSSSSRLGSMEFGNRESVASLEDVEANLLHEERKAAKRLRHLQAGDTADETFDAIMGFAEADESVEFRDSMIQHFGSGNPVVQLHRSSSYHNAAKATRNVQSSPGNINVRPAAVGVNDLRVQAASDTLFDKDVGSSMQGSVHRSVREERTFKPRDGAAVAAPARGAVLCPDEAVVVKESYV